MVQSILLSILTSIITGGFILVFVEIGNRKNRENDRNDQIMRPFMHKLSSYFRFLCWCSPHIEYPKDLKEDENVRQFKKLVETVSAYGVSLISSGYEYDVEHFSASELDDICRKINNIWYYYDKMNPCNLIWDEQPFDSDEYIVKELKEFLPNHLSLPIDIGLVSKVSGDFYTDIYQPIENELYRHEIYVNHFKRQSRFVAIAVGFVLIVLTLILFIVLPIFLMRITGVLVVLFLILCLLLLGMNMNTQIKYYNNISRNIRNTKVEG